MVIKSRPVPSRIVFAPPLDPGSVLLAPVVSTIIHSRTKMEQAEALSFLGSLLGKTLHITILDGRLFTGIFKCTDNESNIVLGNAFEYRMPSKSAEEKAMAEAQATGKPAKADMTSRFVGLIVVPGDQTVKIELEESRLASTATATTPAPSLTIRTKS